MIDLNKTPRIKVTIPVFSGNKIIGHNRIDLVVHTPDGIAIVELKRLRGALRQSPMAARMRAQVAGYAECWARIFPGQRAPRCRGDTDSCATRASKTGSSDFGWTRTVP